MERCHRGSQGTRWKGPWKKQKPSPSELTEEDLKDGDKLGGA